MLLWRIIHKLFNINFIAYDGLSGAYKPFRVHYTARGERFIKTDIGYIFIDDAREQRNVRELTKLAPKAA